MTLVLAPHSSPLGDTLWGVRHRTELTKSTNRKIGSRYNK